MDNESEFRPVVPFINNSQDFCDGVEIGLLFDRMETGEFEFNGIYHQTNKEQIELMSPNMKYMVTFEDFDETWVKAKFSKRMLRLVK